MNFAIAVTPENPVPPPQYGGNERMADIIVRNLLKLGQAVDLYCALGSSCPATRTVSPMKSGMQYEPFFVDCVQSLKERNFTYDGILDMTGYHLLGQLQISPTLSLMTGDPHKKYPHDQVKNRIYVSKEFAAFNGCAGFPILNNIIVEAPSTIPLGSGKGGYALYVGTIRPEKGLHIAVRACKKLGIELKVGGPILNTDYWEGIKRDVTYLGMVDSNTEARWKLFGDASVFVCPILWCDAGPLGPKEALLVGTPVAGCRIGGLCGDIEDGVNGYLAEGKKDFEDKLKKTLEDFGPFYRPQIRSTILPKINPEMYARKLLLLWKVLREHPHLLEISNAFSDYDIGKSVSLLEKQEGHATDRATTWGEWS